MPRQFPLLALTVTTASAIVQISYAQDSGTPPPRQDRFMEEIIVYGSDKTGLREATPTKNLFGLAKPLTETPRSTDRFRTLQHRGGYLGHRQQW
ncbi:hypothetical protein [Kineobactrum salinum]|uniref:Uncharacterized protein n=1 Tax=Kineobactrum salinum TaxID=2708301 RepID=A0A6C0U756_9GAMM|nr:hypothetical protein [Kineobactrum salinum]QIB65314.1 hypothetical protein G3T16_07780 [Kineobactrum salinum]